MKVRILSRLLVSLVIGVSSVSTFADGCYVHSTDWQGGYWDNYHRWQTVDSGFVVQSGGYYWCCAYTDDGTGVRISGVIYSRDYYDYNNDYFCYAGVSATQWDYNPDSAANNVTGTLSIPSYVYGKPVVEIGDYAFYYLGKVTGITIPSTVKKIGKRAFYLCRGLTGVNIPSSVEDIGSEAFKYCSSLSYVSCPTSVKFGDHVFDECEGLRKNGMIVVAGVLWNASKCSGDVVVPAGVTRIAKYAFCHEVAADDFDSGVREVTRGIAITSVSLPDTITTIDNGAFYTCYNLKSINLPANLTSIGDVAFFACKSLSSVEFPEGLKSIGQGAFNYCTGLSRVVIPAGVNSIGGWSFGNCNLEKFVVSRVSAAWNMSSILDNYVREEKEEDYDVYDYFDIGLYNYYGSSSVKEVVIEAGDEIKGGYFSNCKSIERIILPKELGKIGNRSFAGCQSLQAIVIPQENSAFVDVDGVLYSKDKSVLVCCPPTMALLSLPENLKTIENYALYGCEGLTSLVIPNSVTYVGSYAFYGCRGLTSLELPENLEMIEEGTFEYCVALTSFEIPQNVTSIGRRAFNYCSSLSVVTIHSGVLEIGSGAFSDKLKTVWTDTDDSERIKELLSNSGMKVSGVTFLEPTPPHIVVFEVGEHGTRIGGGELSQIIEHGNSAEAPIVQANYGWEFNRWSCDFNVVTNDLAVSALWDRLTMSEKIGNVTWKFRAEGDGVVIENDGTLAVAGCEIGVLVVPEQLDGKVVVGIGECAFTGLTGLRSIVIPSSIAQVGRDAFASCNELDTIKVEAGDAKRIRQLVVNSGFDVSWVEFREKNTESHFEELQSDTVFMTVTNVVVNYVLNSVQPEFVLPVTYDTGFVNIIAEVKGGCVPIPATWTVNYPKFTEKFGTDFTKALGMKSGKIAAGGREMLVWEDYVAGTDPTNPNDKFTASVTIVDGKPVVSYTPELDPERVALRKYTTYGKVKLTDSEWSVIPEGEEADYNFFKVTVEMK